MIEADMVLAKEKDYLLDMKHGAEKRLAGLPKVKHLLNQLLALASAEHILWADIGWNYSKKIPDLTLGLADTQKDSPLPREIVKAFGVRLDKDQAHDRESLICSGEVEGVEIRVTNYRPETCRIVEEEVEVPATRIIQRKIVCGPED